MGKYKINPEMRNNFPQIVKRVNKRFNGPLSNAKRNNVSIFFKRKPISTAEELACEISRFNLEDRKMTLELFHKAISVTGTAAGYDISKPYTYVLKLGKLLPGNLKLAEPNKNANAFFAEKECHFALEKLWEMNVVNRVDKETKIVAEALESFEGSKEKLQELIPSMFNDLIKSALDAMVQLKFGQTTIRNPEDLAAEIKKTEIPQLGKTLELFERCLQIVSMVARVNAGQSLEFHVDLSRLTPQSLKMNEIEDKEIRKIANTDTYSLMIDFLQNVNALKVLSRSWRSENGAVAGSTPKLLYPKRF